MNSAAPLSWADIEQVGSGNRGVRLATLAKFIREQFPHLEVRMEKGYYSSYRSIPGTRLRLPSKEYTGNRLVVREPGSGRRIIDHNAAEPYRTNSEVARKILGLRGGGSS